jgi:uncharacterized protein YukE
MHMTYDTIQSVLQKNKQAQQDLTDQLQKIHSSMDGLSNTFQGKAGKSCMGYWNGTGLRHSQNIIRQLEVMDEKLLKIQQLIEQNDDACAALFKKG